MTANSASERVHTLDPETLNLFALKGTQSDLPNIQIGNANGLKVRRVMQITSDFAKLPFDQLRIIDFACGEGVYSIEAALRGAKVVALDARTERMKEGERAAERLRLTHVQFEQTDVRNVTVGSHGMVDVVFFFGILYHLGFHDACAVLHNVYEMCRDFVIIDTHIALRSQRSERHNGQSYDGLHVREHADADSDEVRRSHILGSLDNTLSFYFTKESLFRLLNDVGFTCVCECSVPFEPDKSVDRITVVATKGQRVKISSYPWVNDKTEEEIRQFILSLRQPVVNPVSPFTLTRLAKTTINGALRSVGLEIRRI
jgi:2-polyprenyl-3-methyl-5-hydroxy-6-metoxy-1,4-benzoquinol methylase